MEQKSFFASSRVIFVAALFILFGTALAIRAYDIRDLPLDFHPTRQLFSAVKARGMYYEALPDVPDWQREFAVKQWDAKVTIEPEILERLAAFFYQYVGEQLWVPRLISAMFWIAGGIFIFLLAREMVSVDGAVLALAFYLLVPYGIFASRSFQPDPLMVLLIVAFWFFAYRWTTRATWPWAILAGLLGGMAIFVKFVAAFFVIGGAVGALLGRFRIRELIRNPQIWTMAVLGVLPGLSWIAYGKFVLGLFSGDLSGRFIPSLLASPLFYIQWQTKAADVVGGIGIMLGLLGVVLLQKKGGRSFLYGIWGAYLVFGLYFNYHISTHDYYSLPLVAIVALSLAPLGDLFLARLAEASSGWVRGVVFVIFLYGVFFVAWEVRGEMKAVDYRSQETYWIEVREALGQDASVVALTEDYGNRLAYWGWQKASLWPSSGDLNQAALRGNPRDLEKLFSELSAKKSHFLVTDMDDFAKQIELQDYLAGYPVLVQGDGYLIYDLQHPLETLP